MADPYQTLGLAKTATDEEIRKAYRKLAKEHHPDLNPGNKQAEARFKEISAAYTVLSDSGNGEPSMPGRLTPRASPRRDASTTAIMRAPARASATSALRIWAASRIWAMSSRT